MLGLVLVACVFAFVQATAADEPISEKEYRKRRSALRSAGGRYITHRKRFPSRCPMCKGSGKRRIRRMRGSSIVDCGQCEGKGVWVSKKDYREVYHDMRSPAFRALPGIKDELGRQYEQATHGRPWPLVIKRYRLDEWELVDATHGIVWFKLNADRAPTPTRWIYSMEADGHGWSWFLYDQRADGPWPREQAPMPTEDSPIAPEAPDAALEGGSERILRGLVARSRIGFRFAEGSESGPRVRIMLEPSADAEGRHPHERVGLDAVRLARTLFSTDTPWSHLTAVWQDHWQDAYGRVMLRPRWVSGLARATHDATAWDTLPQAAQVGAVALTELHYEGWTPVHGAPSPGVPTPETPVAPTPPEEPAAPEPPTPTPATPAPAPSQPTPPQEYELPELTKRAERAGAQGLEDIRALLQAATEAFNAGQQAHGQGAHQLWQEKLAEARTHLEGIKAVWYEDIVPDMPGRDEGEQDAVANEHFGAIWDEVSKLESIVRKVSATR